MSKIEVDEVVNQTGDNDSGIDLSTNDVVKVNIAGSEVVRVNSLGQIGVGITSIDNTYSNSRAIQLASIGDNNWGGTVMLTSADASTVFCRLVASTDGLDLINTKSTNIRFFTSNSERMRIESSGNLLQGCTATPSSSVSGNRLSNILSVGANIFSVGNYSSAVQMLIFMNANGNVGNIVTNGSGTSYNTSSDYRLKENVVTDWDATSRLKQLKPSRFNFKADKDTTVDGFLAHEVSSIVPEAISGDKDAMTKEVLYIDGDEIPKGKKVGDVKTPSEIDPQSIDQSKLVPLLTKALQEAIAKIETLEARVTALEGK